MTADAASARSALEQLATTLASDGYELVVEQLDPSSHQNQLLIEVRAGDGACADCLVPKPIFENIVRAELSELGGGVDLEIRYPVDV